LRIGDGGREGGHGGGEWRFSAGVWGGKRGGTSLDSFCLGIGGGGGEGIAFAVNGSIGWGREKEGG